MNGKNGQGNYILPLIKKHYGHEKYKDTIMSIFKNVNYKDYFNKELFPYDINDIVTTDSIPLCFNSSEITETNIIKEILCFLSFFSCYKEKIINFDNLRSNFEKNIFAGDYLSANTTLDEINRSYGYNFWYLESKMLTSQFALSRVNSEVFYQELKMKCTNSYIRTLTRALWRKTNISESYSDSYNFICRKIKNINDTSCNLPAYLKSYFSYHFICYQMKTLSYSQIYDLLLSATRLNLIDMYILIDNIIVEIVSSALFNIESKNKILKMLSNLGFGMYCKKTSDLIYNKVNWDDEITSKLYILKKILCVNPSLVKDLDTNEMISCINSFELIHMCAKLEILSDYSFDINNSLFLCIKEIIKKLYLKNCDYNEFIKIQNDANRLLMILDNTSMKYSYMDFFNDQFYADTTCNTKSILSSEYYNYHILTYFNNSKIKAEFLARFGLWESDWSHNLQKSINNFVYDNISEKLININSSKNVDSSLLKFEVEKIYTGVDAILSNRYYEKLFSWFINNRKIEKAIELYVTLQFKSKLIVSCFDCKGIDKNCYGNTLKKLKNNMDFCIYAHLNDFRGGGGLRFNRMVAKSVLSILKSSNKNFPSEINIPNVSSYICKEKYIYFFRHICDYELLLSVLTGYSVNNVEQSERAEEVLLERQRILKISLSLEECEYEKLEIKYQIKQTHDELLSLKTSELEGYMISSAKIFEDAIYVSDAEVIFPFYNNTKEILRQELRNKMIDLNSGEFLLFKNSFVKYKKFYISSLDNKIGVYIRHGYFKDEIISFFVSKNLAFKSLDLDKIEKEEKHETKVADDILIKVNFSIALYSFIDETLGKIRIQNTSDKNKNDTFNIYIDDKDISAVALKLINIENSYQFKQILNHEMSLILDKRLMNIGAFVKNTIYKETNTLVNTYYPEFNVIIDDSIRELSNRIEKWFRFIRGGQELCYIDKYCKNLEKKHKNLHFHISNNFPNEITLNKLHYLDLILSNLIINAEEHSGLTKSDLIMSISLSLENKSIKVYFKNNLDQNIDYMALQNTIENLEKNMKEKHKINENTKGRGFYYIKNELDSLIEGSWSLNFCKEELPNSFSLYFLIDWGDVIV